jgi:hypothetical protein
MDVAGNLLWGGPATALHEQGVRLAQLGRHFLCDRDLARRVPASPWSEPESVVGVWSGDTRSRACCSAAGSVLFFDATASGVAVITGAEFRAGQARQGVPARALVSGFLIGLPVVTAVLALTANAQSASLPSQHEIHTTDERQPAPECQRQTSVNRLHLKMKTSALGWPCWAALNIRVINVATGERLRELVLNPDRDYQSTGRARPAPEPHVPPPAAKPKPEP